MTVRQQIIPLGVAVLVGVGAALVAVAVGSVVEPPASPGGVAVAVGPVEAPAVPPVEVPDCEESAQAPLAMITARRQSRGDASRTCDR
jgi:hypothetical protein